MALCSTPVSTACFVWKTERPFWDVSRKSCDFLMLGAKWCLEAKYYYDTNFGERYYRITLTKKKDAVSAGGVYIYVTTNLSYKNDSTESIAYSYYRIYVQHGIETILWKYSEKSLPSDFLTYGAWKIVCVFHDILPPEFKLENLKVDSSTQIEDTSTAALAKNNPEKSVQVSRDFSDTEKLSEDFCNLFRSSSLYQDANLRCGDRTVSVHRSVLAARSRVFCNMFQNESSSDTIDVTDLDGPTLDLLLEYAYSGTVRELSDATVVGLHRAGQSYGMDSLRKACSDWMIDHLTPENCVSFLEVMSDDGSPEEAVASFLCDHPSVFRSPSWDRFAEQQPSLAYKIIHLYALRGI